MEIQPNDIQRCEQLLGALKKASFTVSGEEALALGQVITWVVNLHGRMKNPEPNMKVTPTKEPVKSTRGRSKK